MIRVKYQQPELKDVIEAIIGRSFFIFIQDVVAETITKMDMPARLMNDLTIIVLPHDQWWMGKAKVAKEPEKRSKGTIGLKIQDTKSEMEITLRHEVIHLLRPDWSEKLVESKAQELYQVGEPSELSI